MRETTRTVGWQILVGLLATLTLVPASSADEAAASADEAASSADEAASSADEAASSADDAASSADEGGFKVAWKNGFKFDSPDQQFKLEIGGRIQADFTFADSDAFAVEDGNEFRRARLYVSGTLYGNVEFKAEYDFAGGDAEFKDVYVGLTDTPIGGIRVGHFKEPFSLEELTSSNHITFLERSLPIVFAPSRNTGIMVHDHVGERFTWAVGAFRDSSDFGIGTGDNVNLTARVTGLPIYRDEGRSLLHLGLSYTTKDWDREFRFRSRPEVHQSPRWVDTQGFYADGVDVVDFELAGVFGPLWFLGEYLGTAVSSAGLGDPDLGGFTVQAGFFLTGEHRRYKTSQAKFDRTRPQHPFGKEGKGAWEIALRTSTLDLSDAGLAGGEIDDVTLALNWYLNPATRVMLNYVRADVAEAGTVAEAGDGDFVLLRFQVDF